MRPLKQGLRLGEYTGEARRYDLWCEEIKVGQRNDLADVFHKNNQPNTGSFGHFPCQVPSQASTNWEEEVCLCNKSIHLHLLSGHAAKQCDQKTYLIGYCWVMILPRIQALPSSTMGILQARKVALRGKDDASPFIVEELYAAWAGWHVAG